MSLDDLPNSKIYSYLDPTSLFIENALNNKGRVLVHCALGMSRSPSIVIAYLIKYKKMTFYEALNLVQKKHQMTKPQSSFLKQLVEYEKKLKKKGSCNCLIF